MKILIVCTGNTCRSPMAEGIFKKMAKNMDLNLEISSAGIAALDGDRVSAGAVKAMKNIGIDISEYKSSLVNIGLVEEVDLILTMSNIHKDILADRFPNFKDKVFLINDYAFGKTNDIEDPFGGSLRGYEIARDEISLAIEAIIKNIVNN